MGKLLITKLDLDFSFNLPKKLLNTVHIIITNTYIKLKISTPSPKLKIPTSCLKTLEW